MNKDQCTKLGFLYLTERYLRLKSKFFPGKLYATNGVFYLSIDPSEVMKFVAFCNHLGEDQISCEYLTLLEQMYNKYLNSVCSEANYDTSVAGEMKKKTHLLPHCTHLNDSQYFLDYVTHAPFTKK